MDKDTRNAIERATQRARKLLEEDFAAQLEGDFDMQRDGAVAAKAGGHLSVRQAFQRERIVAAVEHKRAAGMNAAGSVADYLRDAAFTTLNRFVALKMLEARELVQECITKGEQAAGYREFCGLAPGLSLLPDSAGYRLYIESLFDELSTEVKVLFDRRDPSNVLWPKRATFEQLLVLLNATELGNVWGEDETIGWVYQFFNRQDERRKMREESQAPRNSRELAVRNQFFTPRYVVQFLTDNTIGRIWYEMRGTDTVLAEKCEYLVRRLGEEFVPREKKDPRDLRVLDPACGSGHFLLYAFELLLVIYEEAHADLKSPKSESTGKTLAEDYPSLEALRKAIPSLILEHNLHGVDIDARCAQIAQLALWMRAQKAYLDFSTARAERSQIRRSNIVIAEPLVADEQLSKEFITTLGDDELGRVFTSMVQSLSLAGDLGVLLRVEQILKPMNVQHEFFGPSAEQIRETLDRFANGEGARTGTRRRLFSDDAEHGVALLRIAQSQFDVVLMNPPFGKASIPGKAYLDENYHQAKSDLYAAFVERGTELLAHGGRVGAITSRLGLFSSFLEQWRCNVMLGEFGVVAIADLGHGVLDDALVEAAAYVIDGTHVRGGDFWGAGLLDSGDKEQSLRLALRSRENGHWHKRQLLAELPGAPIAYWVPESLLASVFRKTPMASSVAEARWGLQTDDNFRFARLSWEVPADRPPEDWKPLAKGGEYALYYDDIHLVVRWARNARELRASIENRYSWTKNARSAEFYGHAGLTYPERTTSELSLRALPEGCVFNIAGPAIVIDDSFTRCALLSLSYTRLFRCVLEILVGGGDAVESGSAARHYKAGTLNRVPVPRFVGPQANVLATAGEACLATMYRLAWLDETSRVFAGLDLLGSFDEFVHARVSDYRNRLVLLEKQSLMAEDAANTLYGIDADGRSFVDKSYGPLTAAGNNSADTQQALALLELPIDGLVDRAASQLGYRRQTTKAAYLTDRRYELTALLLGNSVESVVKALESSDAIPANDQRTLALDALSYLFGVGIGRWELHRKEPTVNPFAQLPLAPPALRKRGAATYPILVDDPGMASDVAARILNACAEAGWDEDDVATAAFACTVTEWRQYFAKSFFGDHIYRYSKSRRAAPIYWQLATPSASYSVWLYIHAFGKDTLFHVQNDHATPKLAHEERRLESLKSELRDSATAAQRKQLAAQETFVEELRAFLDEVKRVAPLWNPNLDDGVIINFAPLSRLVPQNKLWQKELKSTWETLCDGNNDWAHLAMHLWPERVVPKCAKDRSLAIAHGLEDVFWVEGTDGKWTARETPTRSIDELVRERTSPAVKSSLKSLLEAPVASGKSTGRKGGGRRKAAAVAEGGDA